MNPTRSAAAVLLMSALAFMSGAGAAADTSAASPDAASLSVSLRPIFPVRPTAGTIVIAGRRYNVRAYLTNNLMPGPNERLTGLGTLLITLESIDGRPVPFNIQTVTAEVSQGRQRWRGELPPFADPLALFRGPTWGAEGIRTFNTGSKVNITVTIRANNRDTRTTLRNVVVNAVY